MSKYADIFIKNRVCPMPKAWNLLYQMLPNKRKYGMGWLPKLPLIMEDWIEVDNFDKRVRFVEHLSWAEKENFLDEVLKFLNGLAEGEWHHEG